MQDTSFIPPERNGSGQHQGHGGGQGQGQGRGQSRGKSPHARKVQERQDHPRAPTPRARSGSEGARKNRRHRGKKKGNEDLPQYAAPTLPPPWTSSSMNTKDAVPSSDVVEMTAEETAEMMTALRTAYTDSQEMPDNVKKMVDKYEIKTTEQLRKEMHRTTDSISKARKLLHQLQDARSKYRKSWLSHLSNLMKTLEKQIEAFETQQKDYQERIQKSRREIQSSRRILQRLNSQAAETTIPEVTIDEEETAEPPLQDAEEAELRTQVTKILKKCCRASAVKDAIELSDEDDDLMIEPQKLKRPRSSESGPGDGGAS